jgi:hypothetical protein
MDLIAVLAAGVACGLLIALGIGWMARDVDGPRRIETPVGTLYIFDCGSTFLRATDRRLYRVVEGAVPMPVERAPPMGL